MPSTSESTQASTRPPGRRTRAISPIICSAARWVDSARSSAMTSSAQPSERKDSREQSASTVFSRSPPGALLSRSPPGALLSRSPPGALDAPPCCPGRLWRWALLAPSSLVSPVGAAPFGSRGRRLLAVLAACGGGPSSLVPRSSVQSAPRPSAREGIQSAPARLWLAVGPASITRSTLWPARAASSAPGPRGPEMSTIMCRRRGSQAISWARATASWNCQ